MLRLAWCRRGRCDSGGRSSASGADFFAAAVEELCALRPALQAERHARFVGPFGRRRGVIVRHTALRSGPGIDHGVVNERSRPFGRLSFLSIVRLACCRSGWDGRT